MTAAILLRGHFDGSALRLLARRSYDADQPRHLLRPSKDRLGCDLRRRLALACGPAPAVHGVARWLLIDPALGCSRLIPARFVAPESRIQLLDHAWAIPKPVIFGILGLDLALGAGPDREVVRMM
jgi:hypothetical protein